MKIIQPGDPERASEARRFECPACGCVFVASAGEYRATFTLRNETVLSCTCPTCRREITRDEQ